MPGGAEGARWTTQCDAAGIIAPGRVILADVMNEEDLTVNTSSLPGCTVFHDHDPAQAEHSLAPTDIAGYLAMNFATVHELRAGLPRMRIVSVVAGIIGIVARSTKLSGTRAVRRS